MSYRVTDSFLKVFTVAASLRRPVFAVLTLYISLIGCKPQNSQAPQDLMIVDELRDENRLRSILLDPKAELSADELAVMRRVVKDSNAAEEDRGLACLVLFSHFLDLPVEMQTLYDFLGEHDLSIHKQGDLVGEQPAWVHDIDFEQIYGVDNEFMSHGRPSVFFGVSGSKIIRATIGWRHVAATLGPESRRTVE